MILVACSDTQVAGSGSTVDRPASTGAVTPKSSPFCPMPTFAATVTCLSASLSSFWTRELHHRVVENVVLHPVRAQIPPSCRGVTPDRAYTCEDNLAVYFGVGQQAQIQRTFPGLDRGIVLAWVLGHEMGHIVQFAVHEPLANASRVSAARSREIEQQADCLSGVWVASLVSGGGADAARFRRDAVTLIKLISDPAEVRSHGTAAEREAAIQRGLTGATPQACGLDP